MGKEVNITNFNTTRLGTPLYEMETPALLLDLDKLEANIARMAGFFAGTTANLRPHIKTHKSPIIAKMQIAAGAYGITCAKISEAEVMADAGIKDILLANQVVTETKIERLMKLARRSDVIVAVDSVENARALSAAATRCGARLKVIIETDVGMSRAGTRSVAETVGLAQELQSLPGLVFRGLMGYEGHAVHITDFEQRKEAVLAAAVRLIEAKEAVERRGIPVEIVSAGGTGTYAISGRYPGITEIQAGSYATMDTGYRKVEGIDFDLALTVLTTVISRPSNDRAVLDAGVKSITREFGIPTLKDFPDSQIVQLSEEHAKVELASPGWDPQVGERIELLPTHGCTTINLHERYFAMRNGVVEAIWDIPARGAVV